MIPHPAFGDSDLLVIKNFQEPFDFEPERIQLENGDFKKDPDVFIPGYLKLCLKRGVRREFFEK